MMRTRPDRPLCQPEAAVRILLFENDPSLARLLHGQLANEGSTVDVVVEPEAVAALVGGGQFDLVLLDLPDTGENPLAPLRRVRAVSADVPLILITASEDSGVRIDALDDGADDVLMKPFVVRELVARVGALLRRSAQGGSSVLRVQDLELDRVHRLVSRGGQRIELTPKEFALLEYLMLNAGRRVTRAMITRDVWNFSPDAATNVVEVYINYVRKKIDLASAPPLIHTVRGVGYQLGGETGMKKADSRQIPVNRDTRYPTARVPARTTLEKN